MALAAASLAALPATARADEVTPSSANVVRFEDDPGEASNVTVAGGPGSFTFTQQGGDPIAETLPECDGNGTSQITCNDPDLEVAGLVLGDMNDAGTANGAGGFFISGGEGNDELTGSNENTTTDELAGDDGNDVIDSRNVGPAPPGRSDLGDLVFGAAGDDTIHTGNGADNVFGDDNPVSAGKDTISTGPNYDYAAGGPGDGDRVDLGDGDDEGEVIGDDGNGDTLIGGNGIDHLEVLGTSNTPESADAFHVDLAAGTLVKTNNPPANNDSVQGFEDVSTNESLLVVGGGISGNDVLAGTAGSNRLVSGDGNDTLDPRAGGDSVYAGAGNDTVNVRDGFFDRVLCSGGTDSVQADQFDELSECENAAVAFVRPAGAEQDPPNCRLQGVRSRYTDRAFFRGFSARVSCNENVSMAAKVVAFVRRVSGRLITSRVGELVLAERSVRLGPARRTLRLRPSRRLGRRLGTRFRVRLVIVARDQFGNSRTVRRTIRVAKRKPRRRRR